VPIAAPADKRFRRAHVKPSRRRRTWLTRVLRVGQAVLALAILVYGGYRATEIVGRAASLRVRDVTVKGHRHLSRGEVLALLDGLRGEHILRADLGAWRTRLMRSPWVEQAALRRVLPSTVEVVIRERTPMGIGRVGRDLYLVDDRGVVIDQYGPNYAEFDLPIIDGLGGVPSEAGTIIDADRASLASRLLAALQTRSDLLRAVSQIDVANPHDAIVVLEGETALLHVGEEQFVERLQTFLDVRKALHEQVPDIEYVDLRFNDHVYVRPVAGSQPAPVRPAAATSGR
jgi:cell division protein FtsQ